MFKFLFMAAVAVSISASAQQNAMSLVKTGKYSHNTYGAQGPFAIVVSGNSLVFKDTENKINYFLNTQAGSGIQMLPEEFLKLTRARGATAGVGSLIKSIGIADVQVSSVSNRNVGGNSVQEGSITGKVLVEIAYSTPFGSISGTIEMLGRVDVTRHISTFYYQDKDGKWQNRNLRYSTLRASAGDFLRLTKFESSLPTALNNIVGMLVDLGTRVGSLTLRSTEYIHEDVRP